jgi:hypothetical protein
MCLWLGPADIWLIWQYSNSSTTDVQNWGQPGANLTASNCKQDFLNHVIVFNMALCGD